MLREAAEVEASALTTDAGDTTRLAFLDGLRAVSIVSVVLYHAGVPGFSGGFVGVDIFFVISGYLIIGQIEAGLRSGSFSLGQFWMRRALRILPPFLLTLTVCLVAALIVLVAPTELERFGNEAAAAALMGANYYFLSTQGYFDVAADLKPLLHLWTLAVEEQFYLVAPLILSGAFWLAHVRGWASERLWQTAGWLLAVASFAGCVALTKRDGNNAFYLMQFRAWEFVAGASAARLSSVIGRWPGWVTEISAAVGAGIIAVAVVALSDAAPYPSYLAAIPAIGAVLLIAAGLADRRITIIRTMAIAPVAAIGLVSYSWYLWHWPLLSFHRIYNFGARSLTGDLVAVGVALGLAVATYYAVERPIRRWRKHAVSTRHPWATVLASVAACIGVAAIAVDVSVRVAPALSASIPATLQPKRPAIDGEPCAIVNGIVDPRCTAVGVDRGHGLLAGDSHARVIYHALSENLRMRGAQLSVLSISGCPPLLATMPFSNGAPFEACAKGMESGVAASEAAFLGSRQFAVLAARWNAHVGLPPAGVTAGPVRTLGLPDASEPAADQYAMLADRLRETITQLTRSGVQRVLVLGPVPEFAQNPTACVLRARSQGKMWAVCDLPRQIAEARRVRTLASLQHAVMGLDNARLVDPIDAFCDSSTCRPYEGDVVLYADDHHLSAAGAERLYHAFEKDFEWVALGD